jgi:hypothetical protein
MKNLTHSELSRRRLVPSKRSKRKQQDDAAEGAHPGAEAAEEGPNVAEPMSDQHDDHEVPQDDQDMSQDGTGFETDELKDD